MHYRDHEPPHFHAIYQGHEAFVRIETGEILEGSLPRVAARVVKEWALRHQAELMANWQQARRFEPLAAIPGADND